MSLSTEDIRSRLEAALDECGDRADDCLLSTDSPTALRDQVLCLAGALAGAAQEPGILLKVLLEMNLPHFVPMAADCHCHFAIDRALRTTAHRQAAESPLFQVDRELIACPVGNMDSETLMLFFDRTLRAITQNPPAAVCLRLDGFSGNAEDLKRTLEVFEDELAALRIPLR